MQDNGTQAAGVKKVLNVGGNSKEIPIPGHFNGWEHHLLDIDPRGKPDVLCDARKLDTLAPLVYDGIYCSHNLEHYFAHEVPKVLQGFLHVLKPDGFAEIRVPNMEALFRTIIDRKLDIDDVIYVSKAGPILVRDMIYGFGVEIERSGQDFYAHKTGFTPKSLRKVLLQSGFRGVLFAKGAGLEIRVLALKSELTEEHRRLFSFDQASASAPAKVGVAV